MNYFIEAFAWIFSPDRLTGALPLPTAIAQHLAFTFGSVLIAAVIAIPVGWFIGHTGRGREFAIFLAGAARALPSLGLIVLLVLLLGVSLKTEAAVAAFVLLAIPSILAGAYAGFEAIDRTVIDAGRAMGMTLVADRSGRSRFRWGCRCSSAVCGSRRCRSSPRSRSRPTSASADSATTSSRASRSGTSPRSSAPRSS